MSSHHSSDLCCVCKRLFEKGKQKLECSRCKNVAHRTCLSRMTATEFSNFKLGWKCEHCIGSGSDTKLKASSSKQRESLDAEAEMEYKSPLPDSDPTLQRFTSLSISGKSSKPSTQIQKRRNKIAHLNVNGVKSKFRQTCKILHEDKEILVLALSESKLTAGDPNHAIPGFHVDRIDRPHGERGGGQLIYVHDSCSYETNTLPVIPSAPGLVECNILKISYRGMPTSLLCVIYVPPRDVRNSFFPYFSEVCKVLTSQKKRIVIMGDFNINWLENGPYKRRLEKVLQEFGLVQLVKKPTRGDALLDHVFVMKEDGNSVCEVDRVTSPSDHDIIWMSFM